MWLLIREASMARNLRALLPLVAEYGPSRLAFCTDDRDPDDIADSGHINGMVRVAVEEGVAPEDAIVMASLNPALWHGLRRHGAIAPGYQADLLVLPDLVSFQPDVVLKRGRPIEDVPSIPIPEWVRQSVRVRPVAPADFAIPWSGGAARARRPSAAPLPRTDPSRPRALATGPPDRATAAPVGQAPWR